MGIFFFLGGAFLDRETPRSFQWRGGAAVLPTASHAPLMSRFAASSNSTNIIFKVQGYGAVL